MHALEPMGWLWWVGSLKLQVSFVEYSLFYRALLQKRPIISRSLLIVATPYHTIPPNTCNSTKEHSISAKEPYISLKEPYIADKEPCMLDFQQEKFIRTITHSRARGKRRGFSPAAAVRHMEWLWLVGSLKLQVSFAENILFCRALVQQRPVNLWRLLIVATP